MNKDDLNFLVQQQNKLIEQQNKFIASKPSVTSSYASEEFVERLHSDEIRNGFLVTSQRKKCGMYK